MMAVVLLQGQIKMEGRGGGLLVHHRLTVLSGTGLDQTKMGTQPECDGRFVRKSIT